MEFKKQLSEMIAQKQVDPEVANALLGEMVEHKEPLEDMLFGIQLLDTKGWTCETLSAAATILRNGADAMFEEGRLVESGTYKCLMMYANGKKSHYNG